jgi:predicted RNA-binding protein associated with RNAse of E/G family
MRVKINYRRPGKGTSIYLEDLVTDDGRQLLTHTVLTPAESAEMTLAVRRSGLIGPGDTIVAVRKHYFYSEYFDLLEFFGPKGEVVGYYSDITTPLARQDGEYVITDLFLDVWLTPGHPVIELDEDEFAAAVDAGLLSAEEQTGARQAFDRLRTEAVAGLYPRRYL